MQCNPNIEQRIHNDYDNRQILQNTFPQLLDLYDSFPREIFRADFIRPVYLFEYGGLYADMDFQCLRPLNGIFESHHGIILGKMGTDDAFEHCIPNAMMASVQHQGFWLGYLAFIEEAWLSINKERSPVFQPEKFLTEKTTGSIVLRKAALEYITNKTLFKDRVEEFLKRHSIVLEKSIYFDEIAILQPHAFYPLNWNDKIHQIFKQKLLEEKQLFSKEEARKLFPSSLAVTYWTRSWEKQKRFKSRRLVAKVNKSLHRFFKLEKQ